MEAPAALTTSSDQLDSCSSRTIETSTVTPSFSTVRDRPEWTRFGSRGFIVASISGNLFHGGANYQPRAEVPMSAVSIFSPDVEEFVWDGSVISVQFERSNSTFCTSKCVVSAGYTFVNHHFRRARHHGARLLGGMPRPVRSAGAWSPSPTTPA